MSGGIFLLLCLLAFLIGTRAQKSRAGTLSPKAIRQKEKIKLFMMWSAFVLVLLIMSLYFPSVIERVMIALDTRFDLDTFLSIIILGFGVFTIISIYRAITKQRNKNISL